MKTSRIICVALLFILLISVLCGCDNTVESDPVVCYESSENLAEYILENENLRFCMDGQTSYFTLEDKSSGEIWYSVPVDGSADTMADATMKKWLQSTMVLTYSISSGLSTIFDNYSNSIANGTFQITQQEEAIRVDYLIGEATRVYVMPEMVTEARFEELIGAMEKKEQSTVKSVYRKLDKENPPANEDLDALLEKYPLMAESVIYVRRDGAADYRNEQVEALFAQYGYTEEDYEQDKLESEGEDSLLQFNVSVIYRLEGDSLSVEVPGDSLRCPAEYQMTSLQVLPYFGAGTTEDAGYLLIPDGGGAVIDFNDRKGTATSVSSKVYGWNTAKAKEQMIAENAVSFPVYGIQKNNGYLLAVAEGGAGELTIEANVSGNRNSYNTISPSFEVVHGDLVYVSSKSNVQVMVFEKERQYEDLCVRYFTGDGDSYVSMAHTYREYLMEKYPALEMSEETGVPVAVELIGALDHVTQVAGIPMQTVLPATTYQEAMDIVQQLGEMQIDHLHLKYSGILNGGLKQTSLQKVSLVSELGSKAQLKTLAQLVEDQGGLLYLGGYGSQVMDTGSFDGFSAAKHAIRNTLSDIVEAAGYNLVTYAQTSDIYYILNAEACQAAMENLAAAAEDYGFGGVALEDVGSKVSSDFNKESPTTRDSMAALHSSLLNQISSSGQGVMINGGNDYALPYADYILNMDLSGSNYDLVSRQVPFYQIALHGLVNYAGEAVNMAENYEQNILKSIETGAGLYFLFAEIPASDLQMTDYSVYSSAQFAVWKDTVAELYQQVNEKLAHTYNQMIVDHQYLSDLVTVTVYEDGTHVYVNYGQEAFETEDGPVAGRNYLVTGGTVNE